MHVTSPQGRFAAGAALLDGQVLDRVTSYGKHLFAGFGAEILHVHLGLYGAFTGGTGDPPAPRGALRMRWVADGPDGGGVWTDLRGPTACEVLTPPAVDRVLARLGPDPLRRGRGRRSRVRPHRPQPHSDRGAADGPVGARRRRQRLPRGTAVPASPLPVPPGPRRRPEAGDACGPTWSPHAGRRPPGPDRDDAPEDRARRRGTVTRADAHYVYRRTGCRAGCAAPTSGPR